MRKRKQNCHVTQHHNDSSSEGEEFDDVIDESRRALSLTRSVVNSQRHLTALVRTTLLLFTYRPVLKYVAVQSAFSMTAITH